MRVLNCLIGLVLTVLGVVLVYYALWERAYSFIFWPIGIGFVLASVGCAGILVGFKGDSDICGHAAVKQPGKTRMVYGFVIAQFCILAFQVIYSISSKGSNGFVGLLVILSIFAAPVLQLVLLPAVWLMILDVAKNSWRGGIIATASVWFASASWFTSFENLVDMILL